jgi:RING finger protein 121
VYTWFLAAYKVSVAVGMTGYVMLIFEIFGLGILINLILPQGTSILLIWYGLYFGVLGRDCAEVAADQMVSAVRCPAGALRMPLMPLKPLLPLLLLLLLLPHEQQQQARTGGWAMRLL